MSLLHTITETEFALALSIFFASFAYEDGATLLAATLATAGRLDPHLGLTSAFLGIWIGDMGLYVAGSQLGQRVAASRWLGRFLSQSSLTKAETWFSQRGSTALVISRFVPGSRLPLYLAAGTLRFPSRLFAVITGVCSALWVLFVFAAWQFVPAPLLASRKVWVLAPAALGVPWLLMKMVNGAGRRIALWFRKYRRWEFWPAWLFYPPVAAMCAWLGVRYRGFSLPTVANPSFRNGGIVGESKIEIMRSLMRTAPVFTADAYLIPTAECDKRRKLLATLLSEHSIGYPFVLKPNVGQRGEGFKFVQAAVEADDYLAKVGSEIVLQRYVAGPKEIGVFYYRFPGQERGEILAVTDKVFPVVVGDGVRTFDELLFDDQRAALIVTTYLNRFPELRGQVLAAGKRVRLVEAGNHCQGCIFRDGGHLMSEALRDRIDQISRSLPGFFIGRYDIRYSSDAELQRGENFQIIELNGAASEATNIYDEHNTLMRAYRTLYRQWELVYAIGRANRDLGHQPASALDVFNDWKVHKMISVAYPAAD